MRINGERVPLWQSQHGWSGMEMNQRLLTTVAKQKGHLKVPFPSQKNRDSNQAIEAIWVSDTSNVRRR